MPRTPQRNDSSNLPAVQPPQQNALAELPQDILNDLLAAQAGELGDRVALPRVKVMPAGVGMFEFEDNNDTVREFTGVILGTHAKNVLWDKQFGQQSANEEENLPACSAQDGRFGTPREGFHHLGLAANRRFLGSGVATAAIQEQANREGVAATGVEQVECRTCPYNQYGTGRIFRPQANEKGKANTNQRVIYILMEDRMLPVALVIPPTSLTAYDKYVADLTNHRIPVQGVVTKFSQEVLGSGGVRYGTVKFTQVERLDVQTIHHVIEQRRKYESYINPSAPQPVAAEVVSAPATAAQPEPEHEEDEDIPF